MRNIFIAAGLLLFSTFLNAEPITLTQQSEIQRAHALSLAIDDVSGKVMACMEEPNGSREVCACFHLDSCQFQTEFETATALFCAIKSDFPSWEEQSINYQVEGENQSYALGMVGLERQFGKYCK